jgi:hypothetical protein
MPIGYYRFVGMVKTTFLHFADGDVRGLRGNNNHRGYGYFMDVDYSKLAQLDPHKRGQLLNRLAHICCQVYETEWWYTLLERATFLKKKTSWNPRGIEYPAKLTDFPRTFDEFMVWNGKMMGYSFLEPDSAFKMGTPSVTRLDTVVEMMVLDMTNGLPADSKSRWARCITRHITHYIVEELSRIEAVAPSDEMGWSLGLFQDKLVNCFVTCRRKPGDESPAIIWPTETGDRMIRWRNFGPKIVAIKEACMPTRAVVVRPKPVYGMI